MIYGNWLDYHTKISTNSTVFFRTLLNGSYLPTVLLRNKSTKIVVNNLLGGGIDTYAQFAALDHILILC